jgi:DtxR family Mn-dependent transcriptional regulator|tara:strand:- start:105091 stop:105747 length:657 start_codon:yes stop_codon:yes gene_type:complete
MNTLAEENYLKAILNISLSTNKKVSTNEISNVLKTSPASVTDMLKKLLEKKLVEYEKYKGVELSNIGKQYAVNIIRKHRLWETFLVDHLEFNWSEVHEIAEELEHIKSTKLINKLDTFLGYPKFDPHGDPIPSKEGVIPNIKSTSLDQMEVGFTGHVLGVTIDDKLFLDYLTNLNIKIGTKIEIIQKIDFDQSLIVNIENIKNHISFDVAKNILIKNY